jgi:hypothetical protein
MNNGKHQSSKNVFQSQPNGAKTETLNAAVVQDKTALTRGRAASAQPEPREKPARSRGTDNKMSDQKNTAAANGRPSTSFSGSNP